MIQFFKTHKIIFWALTAVLFGVAAWGTSLLHQKKIEKEKAPQSPALSAVQQPVSASAWKIYRNEELGFEVKIPQRWVQKYKIEEKKTIGPGFGSVSFSKKSEWIAPTGIKMSYDYTVLAVTVVPLEWWRKEMSYDQPHPGFIKITDKKVYIYIIGQDIGSDYEYEEVKKIINTFKLMQ